MSPKRPDQRDEYVEKHTPGGTPRLATEQLDAAGVPREKWREEPTGVHTDAQVFRAVKALGEEIEANKVAAAKAHGALQKELHDHASKVDLRLTKQDLVLERMAGQLDVLVPMKRSKPDSQETKALVEKAIESHETTQTTKFRRDLLAKIVGGIFSAGVLGALIHAAVS